MPCYGEYRDHLVPKITKDKVSKIINIYTPFERATILAECPEYEWREITDYDSDRFFTIGY